MLVEKLKEIEAIYKQEKDQEKYIKSVLSLFKETGEDRFDVAGLIVADHPELKRPLIKAEWEPKIKYFKEKKLSDIELSMFSDLLLSLSKRDDYYITLTKEIFGKEEFENIETLLLNSAKEHFHSLLNDEVNFMTKEELQKDTVEYLKEEYENTYYEKEINKMIEDIIS